MDAASTDAPARGRTIAFRIVAALGGLLFVAANVVFNVASLTDSDGAGIHVVHNMGGLAGFSFLFGIPMLLLAWRPRQVALLRLVVATGLASIIGALLAGVLFTNLLIPPIVAVVLLLLASDRVEMFRLGSPAMVLLALVFIAAIPVVVQALHQAALQGGRTVGDEHIEMFHYAGMAITYLAFVLCGAIAAFPGRAVRTARVLVGLGGAALTITQLAKPDALGSVDAVWAAAGLVLSIVYLAYGYSNAQPVAEGTDT
jgi:hypothetical protein